MHLNRILIEILMMITHVAMWHNFRFFATPMVPLQTT